MKPNLSEKLKTGLTPQEKIDCYEEAIDKIKYQDLTGICSALSRCFLDRHRYGGYSQIHTLFPELIKHKPIKKEETDYWFNSTEERIEVLNKLIEEQKKLL